VLCKSSNCDISCCCVLQARQGNKTYTPLPERPFYDKTKNGHMYCQLCDSVAGFQTEGEIEELLHPNDTQINESLNSTVDRLCPTFKYSCNTMTLITSINNVVCIHKTDFISF